MQHVDPPAEILRVSFESDLEKQIDVHERMLARSEVAQRSKRHAALAVALLSAAITASLVTLILEESETRWLAVVALSVLAGVAACLLQLNLHRDQVRTRIRALLVERGSTDSPRHITTTLLPDAIRTQTPELDLSLPWSTVTEIEQDDESFAVHATGGLSVVPFDAFETREQAREFCETARSLWRKALDSKAEPESSTGD